MKIKGKISKKQFYLLSFTWGLFANVAGAVVAASMLLCGKKAKRAGPCVQIETGNHGDGFSMGMFIFTGKHADTDLVKHEIGHSVQNCYFGPLMPFVVNLPSTARYSYRKLAGKIHPNRQMNDYYNIWFEKQASELGNNFLAEKKM